MVGAARQTRQRPPPTEKTLGRYRIVESIAAGGMGTVHLATAPNLRDPVAVKLLHSHLAQEERFIAMFFEEARLAACVFHRNVVEVFDVEEIDGEYLIAMRYVEGGALSRIVNAVGKTKIEPRIALRIVHDVLLGLHAAHEATNERGEALALVHRDVSPQNILVDFDGVAQLTDFGVARARGGLVTTQGDTIKGKLRYLAPEQLERSTLDRRCDVFAAGIVLWELLRGEPLFAAESDAQTMRNVLDLPITPPGATMRVDEVCLKALERDPERRYGTAEEFARALEAAARGKLASREEVAGLARRVFDKEVTRLRRALKRSPLDSESDELGTIPRGRPDDEGSTEQRAAAVVPPVVLPQDDEAPTLLSDEIERNLPPALHPNTVVDMEHPTLLADDPVFEPDSTIHAPLELPSSVAVNQNWAAPTAQAPARSARTRAPQAQSKSRAAIWILAGAAVAMAGIAVYSAMGIPKAPVLSPTLPATTPPAATPTPTPSPSPIPTPADPEPTPTAAAPVDSHAKPASSSPVIPAKKPPLKPHPAPPPTTSKPSQFVPKAP